VRLVVKAFDLLVRAPVHRSAGQFGTTTQSGNSIRSEHWMAWLFTLGILRLQLSSVDRVVERNADSVPMPTARREG
jgi:hypothetical protein